MRTYCQRISAPQLPNNEKEDSSLQPLSEESPELSRVSTISTISTTMTGGDGTPKKTPDHPEGSTPKSDSKKKTRSEQLAERHPTRGKRTKGPPGNAPGTKEHKPSTGRIPLQAAWEASRLPTSHSKLVLFVGCPWPFYVPLLTTEMPFLHYETDERRDKMSEAIRNVRAGRDLPEQATRDYTLVHAYLNDMPPLHPPRTLDQFFYHGIDTSARDRDQVVYRYCRRHQAEPKVFMVDQLWLWMIGRGKYESSNGTLSKLTMPQIW